MADIVTLQRQTRLLLQDVLNEKTIVIEEQMRQLLQYRQEIDHLGKVQKHKQDYRIEEHQLASLLQSQFITKEGNNYHLLVDVTQLMSQGISSFHIDARIDIVKEIEDDRCKAYQLLNDAYSKLNEENKELIKRATQRDRQNEEVVQQLKEQMKLAQAQFALTISGLQQKIQILQDENEMMEIEAKQLTGQRNNYSKEMDYKQEYEKMCKRYEEKIESLSKLTTQSEQLKNKLHQMEQGSKNLLKQYNQMTAENKDYKEKYEQLKEQNNRIKNKYDEGELSSKVEIMRLKPAQAEQEQYFESKAKVYQMKCTELIKENQSYSDCLLKVQNEKNNLLQKNAKLVTLLERKQQKTMSKSQSEGIKSEIDEELLPFWSQLQTLLKELSAQNEIIIRNKETGNQKDMLSTSRIFEVNLLSKLSAKKTRQMEQYLLASPAEKDTSFPIAQTPHSKQLLVEMEPTKSKHRKKMIRIGY